MQQYYAIKKDKNILYLNSNDFNHIKNVMRMKENDKIIVVYNDSSYICSLNKDLLSSNIIEVFKSNEDTSSFIAYIPLLNEDKMKFVLMHGTELGITEFVVVMYNHCKYKLHKKDYEKKLLRWSKIVKESSEQCYRINKPIINKIIEVKDINDDSSVKLMCSLDKTDVKHINKVLTSKNSSDTISISYGPEGGLSKSEEDLLVNKGFTKVSLGNNVLRTETVILYIASVKSYLSGKE